jgi:predicted enzyme related to lactoylglutathione lyase
MSAFESQLPGVPCWIDLATADVEQTKAFYGAIFGWQAEEASEEHHGYFNFSKNGVLIAGCMPKPDPDMPDTWSVYLRTDDAKQTVDEATAAGATTIVDAVDVDALGTMAIFIDPTGAVVGAWRPGEHKGFGLIGEHGAPGWFELHTRDHDKAVEFYQRVFGWKTEPIPDPGMTYTLLADGEQMYAGIMAASGLLPEGAPAAWKVYFAVDDTDAAVAKISTSGGSILMEPVDTPYGRHAEATDPSGATFKLVGPNESMPTAM